MANFTLIYQILSLLDKYLEYEDPDWSKLSAENFGVTKARFTNIMIMLCEAGLIDGIGLVPLSDDDYGIELRAPRITFSGLRYLMENEALERAYRRNERRRERENDPRFQGGLA